MKTEINTVLEELNREEFQLKANLENHGSKVDECLKLLLNIDKYYSSGNTETKQRIIGSIFPEKLIFENKNYQTTKVNRVVSLICR